LRGSPAPSLGIEVDMSQGRGGGGMAKFRAWDDDNLPVTPTEVIRVIRLNRELVNVRKHGVHIYGRDMSYVTFITPDGKRVNARG
jgi:hypothetical protein